MKETKSGGYKHIGLLFKTRNKKYQMLVISARGRAQGTELLLKLLKQTFVMGK